MTHPKNVLLIALSVCIFIVLLQPCFAQDQSLFVSGVDLMIGMSQTNVLEKLMEYASVDKLPNLSGAYFIKERKGENSPILGMVHFENGRLMMITKDWYNGYDAKGYEIAEVLQSILAQMEQRGLTVATISTRATREPGYTLQTIMLRFPRNRQIGIYINQQSGQQKSLQITESLSAK